MCGWSLWLIILLSFLPAGDGIADSGEWLVPAHVWMEFMTDYFVIFSACRRRNCWFRRMTCSSSCVDGVYDWLFCYLFCLQETELLIQENDSFQRKLLSQEEEFRLQNQTLMAELSLVKGFSFRNHDGWCTIHKFPGPWRWVKHCLEQWIEWVFRFYERFIWKTVRQETTSLCHRTVAGFSAVTEHSSKHSRHNRNWINTRSFTTSAVTEHSSKHSRHNRNWIDTRSFTTCTVTEQSSKHSWQNGNWIDTFSFTTFIHSPLCNLALSVKKKKKRGIPPKFACFVLLC